jgi:hypothetical protein
MTDRTRARAALKALRKQPTSTVSTRALSKQAREAARERGPAELRRAARRAVRTKGPAARSRAARKAAQGRARSRGPL